MSEASSTLTSSTSNLVTIPSAVHLHNQSLTSPSPSPSTFAERPLKRANDDGHLSAPGNNEPSTNDQGNLAKLASVLLTFSSGTSTAQASPVATSPINNDPRNMTESKTNPPSPTLHLNPPLTSGSTSVPVLSPPIAFHNASPSSVVVEGRVVDIPALISRKTLADSTEGRPSQYPNQLQNRDPNQNPPQSQLPPLAAYAKLQGQSWEFYIQKFAVILGRSPELGSSSTEGVDVFLGSSTGISRKHLRIEFNHAARRWECYCFGKSGVLVDGRHFEPFCQPVVLSSRSLIQVDDVSFYFLLPLKTSDGTAANNNITIKKARVKSKSVDNVRSPHLGNSPSSDVSSRGNPTSNTLTGHDNTEEVVSTGELVKPSLSYACLIAEAINSVPERRLTLSSIYQYLADHYPYFRYTRSGWQNSIRHNLSLNKAFRKVPRGPGETGKGMFWTIDPQYAHMVEPPNRRLLTTANTMAAAAASGGGANGPTGVMGQYRRSLSIKEPVGSAPTTPPLPRNSSIPSSSMAVNGNLGNSGMGTGTIPGMAHHHPGQYSVPSGLYVPILPTRPYSAAPVLLAPQLLEAAAVAVELEQQQQQHQLPLYQTQPSPQPSPHQQHQHQVRRESLLQ